MQKLTIINGVTQVEIGYYKPFYLMNLIGISGTDVNLLSTRGYKQDGQTPLGQLLGPREITFGVVVYGNNLQELYMSRRELIRFFNPKNGQYNILYRNDYIELKATGRIDGTPRFTDPQKRQSTLTQLCTISILCDDPYLYDKEETERELAVEVPLIEFPFELFSGGNEFSRLVNKQIIIDNTGDVESPIRVEWTGDVINPVVTNETTGEFIKVNITLLSGQRLIINTAYGNKTAKIINEDGSVVNASNYIDLTSKFWQLQPGENVITYSADSGADSALLFLYYSKRYLGA